MKIITFCTIYMLLLQCICIYTFKVTDIKAEELITSSCIYLSTCGQCLSSPICSWCKQEVYERGAHRCDTKENLISRGCSADEIVNPSSTIETIQNEELSDAGAIAGAAIQLKPQNIHLKLRQKQSKSFTLSFRQAEDYPVDLYYLMDLTWSMKEHKDTLAQLADVLADSMFNITKNFQLGFGSFIDKVAMPYVSMVPAKLENPCGEDFSCSPPYGFQNHLSLTSNVSEFISKVLNASLSANLDNAEGGFDAVMQVIVCKDEIKWHKKSRKIILFATDSIFHYAGDGLLGGVVARNDEMCHLNNDGFYTYGLQQDYPSLSQINRKLTDNKINIIFAVPKEKQEVYQILSSHIEGSYTGNLLKDSSNIVYLIRDLYDTIRSKVELQNDFNDFIKIRYFSKCLSDTMKETNTCEEMTVGTTVEFKIKVELLSCPKNSSLWNTSIIVSPIGLQEYLKIDLSMICECDCEKQENAIKQSEKCSNSGIYKCGICDCDSNHFGRKCECGGNDAIEKSQLSLCRKTNNSQICSGRGECVCGKCDCYPGPGEETIFGPYCECDSYSCERDSDGKVCGGRLRGMCCIDCVCFSGWSGIACDCSTDKSTCISTKNEESNENPVLCSGHGTCICGKCQCISNERESYAGSFCEDCITCEGGGRCSEIYDCIQCQLYGAGPLIETNCEICTYNITTVQEVTVNSDKEKKCVFKDEDACSVIFKYVYNETNELSVFVEEEKKCPIPANLAIVVGSVAAGVFLIGILAVLIIRLIVYLKDKRDCEKFEEELKKTKWGEETNPLYKKAVSRYPNPLYDPKNN